MCRCPFKWTPTPKYMWLKKSGTSTTPSNSQKTYKSHINTIITQHKCTKLNNKQMVSNTRPYENVDILFSNLSTTVSSNFKVLRISSPQCVQNTHLPIIRVVCTLYYLRVSPYVTYQITVVNCSTIQLLLKLWVDLKRMLGINGFPICNPIWHNRSYKELDKIVNYSKWI